MPAVITLESLIGRSALKHINTITLMTNSSLSNAAATASTAEIYSIYFTNHETNESDSTYCCYDLYSLASGTEKSVLIQNWFQSGWLTFLFRQCGTIIIIKLKKRMQVYYILQPVLQKKKKN